MRQKFTPTNSLLPGAGLTSALVMPPSPNEPPFTLPSDERVPPLDAAPPLLPVPVIMPVVPPVPEVPAPAVVPEHAAIEQRIANEIGPRPKLIERASSMLPAYPQARRLSSRICARPRFLLSVRHGIGRSVKASWKRVLGLSRDCGTKVRGEVAARGRRTHRLFGGRRADTVKPLWTRQERTKSPGRRIGLLMSIKGDAYALWAANHSARMKTCLDANSVWHKFCSLDLTVSAHQKESTYELRH